MDVVLTMCHSPIFSSTSVLESDENDAHAVASQFEQWTPYISPKGKGRRRRRRRWLSETD